MYTEAVEHSKQSPNTGVHKSWVPCLLGDWILYSGT